MEDHLNVEKVIELCRSVISITEKNKGLYNKIYLELVNLIKFYIKNTETIKLKIDELDSGLENFISKTKTTINTAESIIENYPKITTNDMLASNFNKEYFIGNILGSLADANNISFHFEEFISNLNNLSGWNENKIYIIINRFKELLAKINNYLSDSNRFLEEVDTNTLLTFNNDSLSLQKPTIDNSRIDLEPDIQDFIVIRKE
ncbi:hypothetical protein F966_01965 [Acinetobacter higginsii]|uniref:Uncharacterized protein n=1 Tax=Acinetobacter higginsii TaxID=70347 RepID=N8XJR8_9GAMM|nr:hypothetical protein [Acinetobacter higginsii]ENV09309.1 hypothetical protein F966_01965 [Acinetobacter higginsii]